MNKKIIAIADSHLGAKQGDVETMVRFLETIDPEKAELLFLGDLFHIWAGPVKYHTSQVKKLLESLRVFQQYNGKAHLVVGNRDIFFPQVSGETPVSSLPFYSINNEYTVLKKQGGTLMAIHGDTVNSKDKQYLRWRRLIRSRLFRGVFHLIPAWKVKKIMFKLEEDLKQTNLEFRHEFPISEWEKYVAEIHEKYAPTLLLVGHFHPNDLIVSESGSTTGIVIPDWRKSQKYLEIDSDLTYNLREFS